MAVLIGNVRRPSITQAWRPWRRLSFLIGLLVACHSQLVPEAPRLSEPMALKGTSIYATSLGVDGAGDPQMAFISGPPDYAVYYMSIGGQREWVGVAGDSARTEMDLSLAFDRLDRPGIAYVDDRVGDLVYAERRAGRWITQTVDAIGQVGHFASLAYDDAGQPHVSYFDNSHNDIKYAVRREDGWHVETIDAEGEPGFHIPAGFTQLVLGCQPSPGNCRRDQPRVAYLAYRYKPYDGELRYARRFEWGWDIETVDSATGAGGFPALVLDGTDHPWISYYRLGDWDFNIGELRLAHFDGHRWQVDVLDDRNNAGRYSALAVRSDGKPIIAYYASATGDLRLAWWDGQWFTRTLLTADDVGARVRLAVGAGDISHLIFANAQTGLTQYATLNEDLQP